MSSSEFEQLCQKVECLSSRVTYQLINMYPKLQPLKNDLDTLHDELCGIIRELPSEVGREERRLLNFNKRYFEKMEREFQAVNRLAAQGAQNGARRVRCDLCNNQYASKDELERHRVGVHGIK